MNRLAPFLDELTTAQKRSFAALSTPEKIQGFLDRVRYRGEDDAYHCPLHLMRTHSGCCYAGALFGAVALRNLGHPPLIVELKSEHDDDHELAVYQKHGLWGAVAKSHYVGLRSREPVFKTVRELAMSYFEHYYNLKRERTLRSYSVPLDLSRFDGQRWMTSDAGVNDLADVIDRQRHVPLFSRRIIGSFTKADRELCRTGLMRAVK